MSSGSGISVILGCMLHVPSFRHSVRAYPVSSSNPSSRATRDRWAPWLLAIALVAQFAAATDEPEVVASYTAEVTAAELESWVDLRGELAGERDQALRELILTRAMADHAELLALHRQPAVRIELARADAKLILPLVKRHVVSLSRASDDEVEARYQEIKDVIGLPRRLRLRNLFKRYPPDASEAEKQAVRRHLEELHERLLQGADFAEMATAESDSQTRLQGGLLGNVRAGKLRPDVDAVAMAMGPGDISAILEGPEGLTVLYCEDELEKVSRTPAEARQTARQGLQKRAYNRAWATLEARLLADAGARFDWPVLAAEPVADDTILVEHWGGHLGVAEVRAMLGNPKNLADLPRERISTRVDAFLTRYMMHREAVDCGLIDDQVELKRFWTRRRVLATALLTELIRQRLVIPTDEEMRQYFAEHRDESQRPSHYHLAVISLPLDQTDPRPVYRLGERLVHDLGRGEISFADAARDHSQHPSAETGGDAGWVSRHVLPGRYGIDVLRAVLRLQVGQRSDLVQDTDRGTLWIIELRGFEEKRPMTFDEARIGVENRLGNRRVRVIEAEILEQWYSRLAINVRAPEGPPAAAE